MSQQTINSFEMGRRRVRASALPKLSEILGVSVENLIGAEPSPAKRGPKPKLQQQLEEPSRLPKPKQWFISEMIDSVLAQEGQRSQRGRPAGTTPGSARRCSVKNLNYTALLSAMRRRGRIAIGLSPRRAQWVETRAGHRIHIDATIVS